MRKNIVAGNWKMNLTLPEAKDLVEGIKNQLSNNTDGGTEVILIPPFPFLTEIKNQVVDSAISVGAQNCSMYKSGAYTGEVAANMLASVNTDYALVGHSERREYFNEINQVLAEKVNRLLENNIKVIYCCGESLEERKEDKHFNVVETQVELGLFHLSANEVKNVVVAYEPVWAIGTGETASPEQAQEMHAHIRRVLAAYYGDDVAEEISILYGGSVKPANAQELFQQTDIDGGLIGGASLKAEDFVSIINAF